MKPKQLLHLLLHNWPAKVLSLAAAVLLVLFHNMTGLEERTLSVPLEVRTADAVVPAETPPERVRVQLRGKSEDIFRMEEGDFEFYLDLTAHANPGEYRVPVQVRKRYPAEAFGVVEINMEPAEITVELAERATRTVEVIPSFVGAPPSGYRVQQHSVNPPEVEIAGPADRVEAIERVETEPVDLSGRTSSFTRSVSVKRGDPLVQIPANARVELEVVIEEQLALTTFEPVELVLINLDGDLQPVGDLPSGFIRVQALRGMLDTVGPGQVQLIADAAEVDQPGLHEVPTRPLLPSGLLVLRYEPTVVELEFQAADDAE